MSLILGEFVKNKQSVVFGNDGDGEPDNVNCPMSKFWRLAFLFTPIVDRNDL